MVGSQSSYSGRHLITEQGVTEKDAMQMMQSLFQRMQQQPNPQQSWFQETLNRRSSPTRPQISFSSLVQSSEPVAPMASTSMSSSSEGTTIPDMNDPEIAQRFADFLKQDKATKKK
jgi:hypothetical protein